MLCSKRSRNPDRTKQEAVVTTESNMGSGSRMKMSWWKQIAKGLIKQKMKRKEDATGEENTPGICASKVWTEPSWERASSIAKRSDLTE